MQAIYFITNNRLITIKEDLSGWKLNEQALEQDFVSFAFDSLAHRMYGGSFNQGLWLSENEGRSWHRLAENILPDRIMSLSISPNRNNEKFQVLWLGSEPSALYKSDDGGASWVDFPSLMEIPSKSSWSFPPRPHTHHIRAIQVDIHETNRIFVGIELGGVMKSDNQGLTWQDRKPNSQFDVHSLTMTPTGPGRIYEAAGGGFAQSKDGGASWQTENDGLGDFTYLVDIAVNHADPDTIIASASKSPRNAYQPQGAESVLVRKEGKESWNVIEAGLPQATASTAFHLMTHPTKANHFYALNNRGLFQSQDGGLTWDKIALEWPVHLTEKRIYGCQLVEL